MPLSFKYVNTVSIGMIILMIHLNINKIDKYWKFSLKILKNVTFPLVTINGRWLLCRCCSCLHEGTLTHDRECGRLYSTSVAYCHAEFYMADTKDRKWGCAKGLTIAYPYKTSITVELNLKKENANYGL